ncbi:hypothetical protein, partial [Klebsiella pneumoniae]|uniref:beta-xylosidase family glycoside hydrolase n=1 Tax=Klebsiella pneumoniae TaxID=573 RepID=UPI0037BE287A
MEDGTPVFNPGYGTVLMNQQRPNLPWTPFKTTPVKDEFDTDSLALQWEFVRVPQKKFYQLKGGQLTIDVQPQVADSLVNASMIVQRIKHHQFSATTKLSFKPSKTGEEAGLMIYRGSENYYA